MHPVAFFLDMKAFTRLFESLTFPASFRSIRKKGRVSDGGKV